MFLELPFLSDADTQSVSFLAGDSQVGSLELFFNDVDLFKVIISEGVNLEDGGC